jgi:sulfide:quinone oxidoreductase
MSARKLTESVSVASQIAPTDVEGLAAAGFRALICNRPDNEEPGQPDYRAIERAAHAAGLQIRFVPLASGQPPDERLVADFRQALDELPSPVLAYCRSGTRSTALWCLAEAGHRPLDDILTRALAAGYDMRGLAPRIATGVTCRADTA